MSKPIIVSETIQADLALSWELITNHSYMVQWYFEQLEAFEPKVGFKTSFDIQAESRSFHHQWEVLEVKEFEKIVYSWTYKDISGEGKVTFSLTPVSKTETKVTVTTEGLESFPQNIPEFTQESCTAGWNYFIKDRLKFFVEQLS